MVGTLVEYFPEYYNGDYLETEDFIRVSNSYGYWKVECYFSLTEKYWIVREYHISEYRA